MILLSFVIVFLYFMVAPASAETIITQMDTDQKGRYEWASSNGENLVLSTDKDNDVSEVYGGITSSLWQDGSLLLLSGAYLSWQDPDEFSGILFLVPMWEDNGWRVKLPTYQYIPLSSGGAEGTLFARWRVYKELPEYNIGLGLALNGFAPNSDFGEFNPGWGPYFQMDLSSTSTLEASYRCFGAEEKDVLELRVVTDIN